MLWSVTDPPLLKEYLLTTELSHWKYAWVYEDAMTGSHLPMEILAIDIQ